MFRLILQLIGVAGLTFILALTVLSPAQLPTPELTYEREPTPFSQAASPAVISKTSPAEKPISVATSTQKKEVVQKKVEPKAEVPAPAPEAFYTTPPMTLESLNTPVRSALVNILCKTTGDGILRPISGSGVIIDPRGVIITNAHVAQFILLAASQQINLSCVIRTGSPASGTWTADVLYFPKAWVDEHAGDIRKSRPLGTGEHDYALLLVTGTTNGSVLPSSFPYIPPEVRSVSRVGDPVLLAAYPAEFSGGNATQNALDASSAATTVKQLLTFNENTIDLVSLGGVVLAQSGSSGGAVVNAWGRLIAIISTTSDGETTADRNLRAVTLSYVARSMLDESDLRLDELLSKNVVAEARAFQAKVPALAKPIVDELSK